MRGFRKIIHQINNGNSFDDVLCCVIYVIRGVDDKRH